MKTLITLFAIFASTQSFGANIQYVGTIEETGRTCELRLSFTPDADTAYAKKDIYRVTMHTKGPFVKCTDYEGVEFDGCASGEQVNGSQEKSLYMVFADGEVQKIYFQNESGSYKTCQNLSVR